jgi:methyl-accepting chemotaxis protein
MKMKIKIGAKLGIGFALVLCLMVVSTVLTYFKMNTVEENVSRMTEIRIPSIDLGRQLQNNINYCASKARQTILAGTDSKRKAAAQQAFEKGWDNVDKSVASLPELAPRWTLQQNRDRLAAIRGQLPNLQKAQQATIDLASNGSRDAGVRAGNEYADHATAVVDGITKSLGDMVEAFDKLLIENKENLAEAQRSMLVTMGITAVLALVAGCMIAVFLGRSISKSTSSVLHQAEAIAAGDLTGQETKLSSNDELGELTTAINKMQSNLRQMIQSISENAQNVANASEEFSAVSQQIGANSEETSAQANAVSAATEEVNRGLQTVASATEEMSASIQEIAKNATEAAKVANSAMKTASDTNLIVAKLGTSSAEIGQVIKVITSIAQKTDLLALNATVEAARAREVGAGFAVVANEVKELAKQTASATEDISRKIETIQADAKSAVTAIASISEVIGHVNDISGTIATAVEEQSATTSEMSRNLSEAAKGSGDVAQNIHGVAQAAQSTSQGATDSQKAAKELAQMSTQLQELVHRFKVTSNGHSSHTVT